MKSVTSTVERSWALVFSDFKELTKMRLSLSVVFSSIAGYLLGAYEIEYATMGLLAFGGYCMVGASNAYNQIIERDLDALMKRTRNRPIPAGRVSVPMAMVTAVALTLMGLVALYLVNPKTALFGAISIFLYTSVYTPLKTVTPLAVFVGALPGAIPFMLGWVAATNTFGIEPGTLFMIQFFWQFPHFWALGWMLDDDYKKGGFKMLPTGSKDRGTALQIILYTIWMIVTSVMPFFGFTGRLLLSTPAACLILIMGLGMLYFAFGLYVKRDNTAARKLMLASVSHITLMQLVFVIDKFSKMVF
ncbi:MAG: heme o synthase [Bacteroidota bacterium]